MKRCKRDPVEPECQLFFRIVSVGGRQWWVVRSHEQKEACHSVFCGQSAVDSIDAITDSAIDDLDEI